MKDLHNIWELAQLPNNTLKEICFELDYFLLSENTINYNSYNKTKLCSNIVDMLFLDENVLFEGEMIQDEGDAICYLEHLVKIDAIELTNH
tara:strand:+ start:945 stop:1217 length:273 start_codon:yes stop_codon:yes gene_type:complete